ncbi:MAG: hypothetical protein ABH843_06145 [Candidatus Omnitrophota bacterium]
MKNIITIILILTFSLNQLAGVGSACTDSLRPVAYKRSLEPTENLPEKAQAAESAKAVNIVLGLEQGLKRLEEMISELLRQPGKKRICVVIDGLSGVGSTHIARLIKRRGIADIEPSEISLVERDKVGWPGYSLFVKIREKFRDVKTLILIEGLNEASDLQGVAEKAVDICVNIIADKDSRLLRINGKWLFMVQKIDRLTATQEDARFDLIIDNSILADKRDERKILSDRKRFEKGASTISHIIYEFFNELPSLFGKLKELPKKGISVSFGPEESEGLVEIRDKVISAILNYESGFDREHKNILHGKLDYITKYIYDWRMSKFFEKELTILEGRKTIGDIAKALELGGPILVFGSEENYQMALAGLFMLSKRGCDVENRVFVFSVEEYLDRTGESEIIEEIFKFYHSQAPKPKEGKPSDILMELLAKLTRENLEKASAVEKLPRAKKVSRPAMVLKTMDSQA